ncbi:MAG: F0F1 ATP synthase subunit gamma [Deltaproteobacteria bacterium]|nr:F0F1 ATP synthase subunit gamma [Deltaproteobacteria bacterium]
MPQLKEIEKQLNGVRSLKDIVHSMRSLAAVNLYKTEKVLQSIRQYRLMIQEGLGLANYLLSAPGPKREDKSVLPTAYLIFTSDQGLSGTFNEKIIDFVQQYESPSEEILYMVSGIRGRDLLQERKINVFLHTSAPNSIDGIKRAMRDLSDTLYLYYSEGRFGSLILFYNVYESVGRFTPTAFSVLPLDITQFKKNKSLPTQPHLYLTPEELLPLLLEEYLFIELYRALAESLASENSSRLKSMDSAGKNIDKKIEELLQLYRISRQEEITSEMLEIISGAEALKI